MSRKATTDKTPRAKPSASTGRFSYEGLDRVLHEKARLGILASLAANPDGVLFNDLKQLCALTDGNLSRHLSVLHEAGLLETWAATANHVSADRQRPAAVHRIHPCAGAGRRRRAARHTAGHPTAAVETAVAGMMSAPFFVSTLYIAKSWVGGR